MNQFRAICSRNLKINLRDRGSIFFSFLSMIIIIGLMLLFLGDTTVDTIMDVIKQIPGRGGEEDRMMAQNLIYLWTTAGIMAINSATITLAVYSNMIKDRTGNRLNSIMVMPISRGVIVLGYIVSAWMASVVMSLITLGVIEGIGVTKGIAIFPVRTQLMLILVIMLNSFVYSAVMYFAASLIKTEGAWSGFGIVVGTLVGFLGGIYFPIGALSETVQGAVKCFPIIYGTSMFRKIMMGAAEDDFYAGCPDEIRTIIDEKMGISLKVFENTLSMSEETIILIGIGIAFALLSVIYLKFSKKSDR